MGDDLLPTDPYAVLGIASTASSDEIRAAWKAAALRTHPDKVMDDGTQFRAVQAAYEVLRDAPPPVRSLSRSRSDDLVRTSSSRNLRGSLRRTKSNDLDRGVSAHADLERSQTSLESGSRHTPAFENRMHRRRVSLTSSSEH